MLSEIPVAIWKSEAIYNSYKVSFQAAKKVTAEELRFVLRRLRFLSLSSSIRAIEAKIILSYPICSSFPLSYQLICLVSIQRFRPCFFSGVKLENIYSRRRFQLT